MKEAWELDLPEDVIKNMYMEGLINHMVEAGIDPATHDPTNYIYFQEMAGSLPRDKSGRCKLIVAVGRNERNIAHFHVFRNNEDLQKWRNGACLYFTKNKYYDHSNNTETLTRDELKELVQILKSPHKDLEVTNWKYLVALWNDNNDRYEVPDDTPMPNYDYKTIIRYKEKNESEED